MARTAVTLIFVGAVILFIALWVWQSDERQNARLTIVGQIARETGETKLKHPDARSKKINEIEPLAAGDEIETNDVGEANARLDSGINFRVLASSHVILSAAGSRAGIFVQRGRIQFEPNPANVPFVVTSEGRQLTIDAYQNQNAGARSGVNKNYVPPTTVLTEAEIQQTLALHRPLFFRCYAQVVQKSPAVKGHANLIFTLEANGKVKFAEVNQSDIDDVQFKSCLAEAVKRIAFRNAPSGSLTVNFPLDFQ